MYVWQRNSVNIYKLLAGIYATTQINISLAVLVDWKLWRNKMSFDCPVKIIHFNLCAYEKNFKFLYHCKTMIPFKKYY